ncbi:MAG: DNA primase, partial [Pseudomonadota bacterium]
MRFSKSFIDNLRQNVSLVDIVAEQVQLTQKRRGDYWGCCPFHHEKTPSFHVLENENYYHCFGCSAHGDAIKFICETQHLSFSEAIEYLAKKMGIALPIEEPRHFKEKTSLDYFEMMNIASRWYQECLHSDHQEAFSFLKNRGLDEQAIRHFEIGFAPFNQDALKNKIEQAGGDVKTLQMTGLFKKSDYDESLYPFFRDRVVIPIHQPGGRVIAFGGRVLPSQRELKTAKYINSSDNVYFKKGEILFNEHRAKKHIRSSNELILAEGYMDVIALSNGGFEGVVAPLGTALTGSQIRRAWKLHDEPILCFDGDSAGRKAAYRAARLVLSILENAKSLRFIFLPEGEDPDTMIQQGQTALIRQML